MAEAYIRPLATGGPVVSSFDRETLDFIESVEFSMSSTEDVERTIEWSVHPVEAGSDITDNAKIDLERVSLAGVITQTPIIGGDATTDRLAQADEVLSKIATDRQPVQVITGLRVLDGYVVTGYSSSRGQGLGQALSVTLELQEVVTVEARFVEVAPAPVRADKKAAAAPAVDGGTKAPTETTEEAETGEGAQTPKSVAKEGVGLIGKAGNALASLGGG